MKKHWYLPRNSQIKLTLINSHDSGEDSQNISFSDEEIVIDFDEKQEESEEYYEDVIFQTGKRSSSLTVIYFWESHSENRQFYETIWDFLQRPPKRCTCFFFKCRSFGNFWQFWTFIWSFSQLWSVILIFHTHFNIYKYIWLCILYAYHYVHSRILTIQRVRI